MHKLAISSIVMLLWGIAPLPVLAAEIPPALSQTALVCRVTQTDFPDDHKHPGVTLWDLEHGKSRLELQSRWLRKPKHYVDVKDSWPNKLQGPHFYVVNPDAAPAASRPVYPDGCSSSSAKYPIYAKPAFVFAFAISEIENNRGASEPKSPHLLLYLPLQTGANLRLGIIGEFQLRLYHMEKTANDCVGTGAALVQCRALVALRESWEKNKKDGKKLVGQVGNDIHAIAMFDPGPFTDAEKVTHGFLPGDVVIRALYHNGVIHGTF
jgi:hypothetical protein